jgi:hypothetical protein
MTEIVGGRAVDFPVFVRALTYHTIYNANPKAEGDVYELNDAALFETVIAIGFVEYAPEGP